MVNMYSSSMIPMGMNNNAGSINVHQNLKAKYGVGLEDSGTRPYTQPYPMAVSPIRQHSKCEDNWLVKLITKCFLT